MKKIVLFFVVCIFIVVVLGQYLQCSVYFEIVWYEFCLEVMEFLNYLCDIIVEFKKYYDVEICLIVYMDDVGFDVYNIDLFCWCLESCMEYFCIYCVISFLDFVGFYGECWLVVFNGVVDGR